MDSFIDSETEKLAERAMSKIGRRLEIIDKITEHNQLKTLDAFRKNYVCESHFAETTGYGYGDRGRDVLDSVFADAVGAQSAFVRHTLTCGTHTLTVALFGLLRPGHKMLCVTGIPYDTILPTIGICGDGKKSLGEKEPFGGKGSLRDYGIEYRQTDLDINGEPDFDAISKALEKEKIDLVYIQRSRGYTLRPGLSVEKIGEIVKIVREKSDAYILVDNCYGEFAETREPLDSGADLIAGSLIKNPGGGLARNGGYIAGSSKLVELCACRATAPGLGAEVGASLGTLRSMFMGLFNAPHVTGEALKTAVFAAALFEEMGYETTPSSDDERYDIIQAIKLGSPEKLVAFCRGIQSGSPVDSFAAPEPWDMPGYDSKVIMAAGTFISGSSIELSADAPLRPPYAVWLQGGLNFHSAKFGVKLAAQAVRKESSR